LNQTWALDFMTDTLYDSRRIRLRTVMDEGNPEALDIAIGPRRSCAERTRGPAWAAVRAAR
jgi:hypothetical protein